MRAQLSPVLSHAMSGCQAGRRTIQCSLRVGVDERGRIAGAPQQAPHSLQPRRRSRLQLQPDLPQARSCLSEPRGAQPPQRVAMQG